MTAYSKQRRIRMKTTLSIKGMHCASCAILIKESVEELEGIAQISIDRNKNSATIYVDEIKTSISAIKKAIKKEGYDTE